MLDDDSSGAFAASGTLKPIKHFVSEGNSVISYINGYSKPSSRIEFSKVANQSSEVP